MPSVQIKDVPADTHAVLRRRAAEANQSLQVLRRITHRSGGVVPLEVATEIVRAERDRD
jgi:hypothetical protein